MGLGKVVYPNQIAVEMDAAKKSSNYSGKNPNPSNPNMTKAEWKAQQHNERYERYQNSKVGAKTVPNPNGKKGGIPHQNKINEIAEDIKDRGLRPRTEYKYDTTGGYKNTRYADVVGLDSQGRVAEIHQVGRSTKKYGSTTNFVKK